MAGGNDLRRLPHSGRRRAQPPVSAMGHPGDERASVTPFRTRSVRPGRSRRRLTGSQPRSLPPDSGTPARSSGSGRQPPRPARSGDVVPGPVRRDQLAGAPPRKPCSGTPGATQWRLRFGESRDRRTSCQRSFSAGDVCCQCHPANDAMFSRNRSCPVRNQLRPRALEQVWRQMVAVLRGARRPSVSRFVFRLVVRLNRAVSHRPAHRGREHRLCWLFVRRHARTTRSGGPLDPPRPCTPEPAADRLGLPRPRCRRRPALHGCRIEPVTGC